MTLQPLRIDGVSFADPAGRLLTYGGFSSFRLLDRFLRGEDVQPVFDDLNAVLAEVRDAAARTGDGAWVFPVLRVLGMMHFICRLYPQESPTFYTSVSALTDLAGENGFYVKWDVLADCDQVMPDRAQRVTHWLAFNEALRGRTNALVSGGNEFSKNGFDPGELPRPATGVLAARGSNVADAPPYKPAWDFSEFHGRRDGIKGWLSSTDLGYMALDPGDYGSDGQGWGLHEPVIHDEPEGAATTNQDGKRSSDPSVFYRLAVDCTLWGAGGTFHSDCGIQSVVLDDRTRACAAAWVMGLSKTDPVQRFNPMRVL